MTLSRAAVIVLSTLALTVSGAAAEGPRPPIGGYVAANLIPDAPSSTEASAEAAFRLADLPLFAHAEIGSGAYRAAGGLEVRTRTGAFSGYTGVDAGYDAMTGAVDPILRVGMDMGGTIRLRLGVDTAVSRQDVNTISPLAVHLKVGVAYVF